MMAHETRLSEQASNVKFVYEVKKRQCLYNPDLMTYSRKDITDQAWEEVGKIMNMSGGACKEKWRNLRIVYMRHMKSSCFSGTGRRKRRYYLSDAMQFLLPYIKISPQAPPKPTSPQEAAEEKEKTFYDAYRFTTEDEQYEDTTLESRRIPTVKIEANGDQSNDKNDEQSENGIPESWRVPVVKIEVDDDDSNDTNQGSEVNSCRKRSAPDNDHFNCRTDMEQVDHASPRYVTDANDPVISFLNSLVTELKEMKAAQFKSFKRRVLALIDDITEESKTS